MKTPTNLIPVTRHTVATVILTNGVSFKMVHDLDPATWTSLFDRWIAKTKRHDMNSLWHWIKARKPHCICVPKAEYDRITAGKTTPATKAQWLAENN